MKNIHRAFAWTASVAVLALSVSTPLTSYADATPTLDAAQTVASVSETKANRILNVATLPVTTNTLTIGSCAVTFATTTSGAPAQDLDCTGGATVTTAKTAGDVAKTAAEIATALSGLTNVTDTGHGALTVAIGTTTTKVSFTTTGTEAAATNITFTDGTSGKVLSAGNTPGVIPVAQRVTFTPSNVRHADFSVTINGSTYTHTAPANSTGTVKSVVEALNVLLAANAAVTCTEDDSLLTCTSVTAGTTFTYSSAVVDLGASSGGGGGGSSHHRSGQSVQPVSSTATITTSVSSGIASQIAALQAQVQALMGGTSAGTAASAGFMQDLTVGSTGADVKNLQMYLNAHGAVVSASGAGSVGNETMTFGGATKAALAKFQTAAGISPASGYFGPKTRAYVQAHP